MGRLPNWIVVEMLVVAAAAAAAALFVGFLCFLASTSLLDDICPSSFVLGYP